MKKNKISKLFWALIALVSYAISSEVVAQNYKKSRKDTIHVSPNDSNFEKVCLYQIDLIGNDESVPNKKIYEQTLKITTSDSAGIDFSSIETVLRTPYESFVDTGDIYLLKDGKQVTIVARPNFELYRIWTTLYVYAIVDLRKVRQLEVNVVLGMEIQSKTPKLYYPEPQLIINTESLGTKNIPKEKFVYAIYPNPFTTYIKNDETKAIEITDLSGKKIYKGTDSFIETSNWGIGVYIVRTENNSVYKMVKTN